MSDKELVDKILAGYEKLLRRFVKEYRPRLFSFIHRFVDNPEDAEEVVQETLISSLYSLPLYSARSKLFTWMCSIARHEISDFYRKKRIKSVLFSHFPQAKIIADAALGPEEILTKKEFEEKIKLCFSRLSEGYREVLRLKYIEGRSVNAIAKTLGESVKAVESRLFRARQAFIGVWVDER